MAPPWCSVASSSPARASSSAPGRSTCAHVFLFAIYIAEISYVASSFENPLYAEEMNALDFIKQPEVAITQALLLKFKPVNMDVLPLYIVLLLLFPLALWLLVRNATLAARAVRGALCADLGIRLEHPVLSDRALVLQSVRLAAAVRVRRLVRVGRRGAARADVALADHQMGRDRLSGVLLRRDHDLVFPARARASCVPRWLGEWMYPIDKTNLDVLRFAHFPQRWRR